MAFESAKYAMQVKDDGAKKVLRLYDLDHAKRTVLNVWLCSLR
jgi:hypothetical protein